MIESRGITKRFGELAVLKGVNFRAEKGEVVSIMGDSGAGKTTFLQILGTLYRPDAGEIYYGDQAVHQMDPKKRSAFRNQNIGFVFQFHHLLPEFTALENVAIPAFIQGLNKKEGLRRAGELLALMGLEERSEHKPQALSGGEQQRVAVARALINRPQVVLADEPTGNLDSKNAWEMHRLFEDLRQRFGTTFVIITHNPDLAATADRTVQMKDGKLMA